MHFVNGHAEFHALVKPPFFNRPFGSPLVPVYRSALQPVTTRITGSWRPLSREFGAALLTAVWITVCTLFPAAGFYLRWSDPFERESMVLDQRLTNKLPVEARQLAEKGDVGAAGAWLQSAFKVVCLTLRIASFWIRRTSCVRSLQFHLPQTAELFLMEPSGSVL